MRCRVGKSLCRKDFYDFKILSIICLIKDFLRGKHAGNFFDNSLIKREKSLRF